MFRVTYCFDTQECSEKEFIARTDVWGYTFAYDKQGGYIVLLAGEYAIKFTAMPSYQEVRSRNIQRKIKNSYTEEGTAKGLQCIVNHLKKSKKDAKHKIADAIIAAYGNKLKGGKND